MHGSSVGHTERYPYNTQVTQKTNIQAHSGIEPAIEPIERPQSHAYRPTGHWDVVCLYKVHPITGHEGPHG